MTSELNATSSKKSKPNLSRTGITTETFINDLDGLKPFIEYLQQFSVKKFKIGDLEIDFEPQLTLLKASAAQDLEDAPASERLAGVRKTMEEITKEQDADLFWSTK